MGWTAGGLPGPVRGCVVGQSKPGIAGRDIYTAAALLIRKHSSEAHSIARNRAEELKATGDEAGYAAFTRIAEAIKELGQLEPAAWERRMQPAKARAIREAIDRVAANPSGQHADLRPLANVPDGYRVRVGDWRVSCTLDRNAGILDVFEIDPRGGAYR